MFWERKRNISRICFGSVKETSPRDVSFTHPKRIFDREKPHVIFFFFWGGGGIYFHVYRPIVRTTDNSK